jgi:hypothetical protein
MRLLSQVCAKKRHLLGHWPGFAVNAKFACPQCKPKRLMACWQTTSKQRPLNCNP